MRTEDLMQNDNLGSNKFEINNNEFIPANSIRKFSKNESYVEFENNSNNNYNNNPNINKIRPSKDLTKEKSFDINGNKNSSCHSLFFKYIIFFSFL